MWLPPLTLVTMEEGLNDLQVAVMVAGFVAGVIAFLVNIAAVMIAIYKMGRAVEKFENIGKQQASEISQLKTAIAQMAQLVTDNTLLTHRQETIEHRINQHDKMIDDLRRGEGMILPLNQSPFRYPPSAGSGSGEQR